jgi:hypothetical protein
MALFSRKAIADIIANETTSAEDKIEQIFSLHGQHLDNGYVTKAAAEAAKQTAVEEAQKNFKIPDAKESAEYKALQEQFNAYKVRQDARSSADYANVKPKFFDAVYDRVDHAQGAKPIKDQLAELAKEYEEYFMPQSPEPAKPSAPQFGGQAQGSVPTGDGKPSFADLWGYKRKE